jgi:hypothetical protein
MVQRYRYQVRTALLGIALSHLHKHVGSRSHRLGISRLCSTARPAVAPAASACTPDEFYTNLLVVSICFPELFAEFKKHYQIRIPDNALLLTFKT